MTIRVDEIFQLNAEIERLHELLRSGGANRYWEGRWRDEAKENERLRAALLIVRDLKVPWQSMPRVAGDALRGADEQKARECLYPKCNCPDEFPKFAFPDIDTPCPRGGKPQS